MILSYPYLADLFLNGVVELQFRRLRCLVDLGLSTSDILPRAQNCIGLNYLKQISLVCGSFA